MPDEGLLYMIDPTAARGAPVLPRTGLSVAAVPYPEPSYWQEPEVALELDQAQW